MTSLDWLESDRVLAGIMTAFGSPTGAVDIGGAGQFDGVMLLGFTKPRIEGTFTGERMRAWDTEWGRGTAQVVIENSYVTVSESVITDGTSDIRTDGKFSLGYPRRDNGEEINARVRINRRRLADLRHAFELDDYPVEGIVSGEYHLYGKYETPFGFGRLAIDDGVAYGEPFETATASLRFEGSGVRLDAHGDPQEHRHHHRRRLGRMGRQLLVQRRRHAHSGRIAEDGDRSRARRCRACCSSRPRGPARSTSRATTSGCGWTICSPATKGSASSPAACRCAASS